VLTNAPSLGFSNSFATNSKHSANAAGEPNDPVPRVDSFQILLNAPSDNPLGLKNLTACSPRIVPDPFAFAVANASANAVVDAIVPRSDSGVHSMLARSSQKIILRFDSIRVLSVCGTSPSPSLSLSRAPSTSAVSPPRAVARRFRFFRVRRRRRGVARDASSSAEK
jgi:hypothetical protein